MPVIKRRSVGLQRQAHAVFAWLALAACGVALSAFGGVDGRARAEGPPTAEEYLAHVGGDAKLIPPGKLTFDNKRALSCGQRPTVLDGQLDDFGAAYPGFLILNPKLMAKVSLPVKMWIFSHECGHQFRGPDEETADCFAVQRGRREGWLSTEGLDEVCRFISPAKGDSMHFSGVNRCDAMRKCYADPIVR